MEFDTFCNPSRPGAKTAVCAGKGVASNTVAPEGRPMSGVFRALAEFERGLIVERTPAGLASTRAEGHRGGQPYKMTPAKLRLAQAAMGRTETGVGELCAELGVTRQTFYRHVDRQGRLQPNAGRLLRRRQVAPDQGSPATPTETGGSKQNV